MTNDPSAPEYNAKARDAIMDLCPFYDPNHKCGVVREEVFRDCLKELRGRIRMLESAPTYFDGANNLAYLAIFLRNGGERLRAIWLVKNTLNIELGEAKRWVDEVQLVDAPAPEFLPEFPPRVIEPAKVANHWPPSVTDRMKLSSLDSAHSDS